MRISQKTYIQAALCLMTFHYMYGMSNERKVSDIIPQDKLSSGQVRGFIPQIARANNTQINKDIDSFVTLFDEYLKTQNDLALKNVFGSFNYLVKNYQLSDNQTYNYKKIVTHVLLEKIKKEDAKRRKNLLLISGALTLGTITSLFLRSYTDQSAPCKEKILQEELAQGTFDVDPVAARDRFDIYSSFVCDTMPGIALKMFYDASAGLQCAGSLIALLKAREENPRTKKLRGYLLSLGTEQQS